MKPRTRNILVAIVVIYIAIAIVAMLFAPGFGILASKALPGS